MSTRENIRLIARAPFDILENILYSSMVSFMFMFLVNHRLVWRDKTVLPALELWCM